MSPIDYCARCLRDFKEGEIRVESPEDSIHRGDPMHEGCAARTASDIEAHKKTIAARRESEARIMATFDRMDASMDRLFGTLDALAPEVTP